MYLFSIAAHEGDDLFFPPQMFEYMNSYDLACSVGGGEDSSAVLQRAGLTFICNCDLKTPLIESKIPADILFCELLFKIHVRGSKCDFFFFFYYFSEHKCYNFKPEPRTRRAADYVQKFNAVGKMQNNSFTIFDHSSHDLSFNHVK